MKAPGLLVAAALLTGAWPSAFAQERKPDLAALRNGAIEAYNAQSYAKAATLAAQYLDRARVEQRTGREFAALQFVLGHSRFEAHRKAGSAYPGDYYADVVAPIEESLLVLQDDAAFKNMLLANAYHELWLLTGRLDAEAEERDHWYLLKSILIREQEARERKHSAAEDEILARHLLFYLERCLELSRTSDRADLYLARIRSVAPWGFGSAYDARFWQIHDLTYFDDGNMRAAAQWQRGLDLMRDPKADPNETLAVFQVAADRTRGRRDRAEVYRQMSDFVATLDDPERRLQAADFGRRAFDLNPGDAEIRRQYGTSLHVLSYAAYAGGRFEEALAKAVEATSFQWEGMEAAHFDLSRAAAEMGRDTEALTHGERAFRLARETQSGAALQPFAQNYVNVLRQFGQEGVAARVLAENPGLGVR
jgi:hypothetical protein